MKLLLILLFIPFIGFTQLGKYSPTVTYTTTNPTPSNGDVVTYCVTISDFTECNACWFDALEIQIAGGFISSYTSRPNANWKTDSQINDEPAGWLGWTYNAGGNPSKAWNDIGQSSAAGSPWIFCFDITYTSTTALLQINIWGDYDTGGWFLGCGTQGDPDGPYTLFDNITLPVGLVYFEGYKLENNNLLEWVTYSEVNSKEFYLERSTDFENWDIINIQPGQGNSNSIISYSFIDENYINDLNYYRITQVDFDGNLTMYDPIVINNSINEEIIGVYNILGQEVQDDYKGIIIIVYKNGLIKKIYNNGNFKINN